MPKLPLSFGGGLDRSTGVMEVEPSSFEDLENVHLRIGRAERRKGLAEKVVISGEDAILAVHPVRSQGVGAILTYRASTREVRLWLTTVGASNDLTLIGVVWTLAATAPFPRVICADSYDKLVIAHDEPNYGVRKQTRWYDVAAGGTIQDLTADLYLPAGAPVPVYFRGVTRWLSYLVGWGYGTENPGDDNRPEILRISLPGEPLNFQPNHYFVAGQRGDPILWAGPAGNVLAVRKASESYDILGTSRANFDIRPSDNLYGVAASRLSLTIGDVNYFWSLDGPRRSMGGPSEDLALPLDLANHDTGPADYAFAAYRPDQKELEFIFGLTSYVLHLAENSPRWSIRPYGVLLSCAGVLYEAAGGSTALGPAAYPAVDGGATTQTDATTILLAWANVGTLTGGEYAEIWGQAEPTAAWTKLADNIPVAGATQIQSLSLLKPGRPYNLAVRFKSNGLYSGSYLGADPLGWPAVSRLAYQLQLPKPVLQAAIMADDGAHVSWTNGVTGLNVTLVFEVSRDGGATWVVEPVYWDINTATLVWPVTPEDSGSVVDMRIQFRTTWTVGAYSDPISAILGIEAPYGFVSVGACDGDNPTIRLEWNSLASGDIRIERRFTDGGGYVWMGTVAADLEEYVDASVIPGQRYIYRIRREVGLAFSPWVVGISVTAPNCGQPAGGGSGGPPGSSSGGIDQIPT